MLPHLDGRPLTMKRMPDGIDGPFFYEKSAPSHVAGLDRSLQGALRRREDRVHRLPDGRRRSPGCCSSRTSGASSSTRCTRAATTSSIPTTSSSTWTRSRPTRTRTCSRSHATSRRCSSSWVSPRYPKTSGATGLQIYVPIERGRYTYDQVRALRGACGRLILQADPDRVTMAWKVADRTGQDLHRPQHEPRRREHRGRVLAAARAPSPRLDAAHVGRGRRGGASSPRTSGSTTCGSASRGSATCSPACSTEAADLTTAPSRRSA